MRAVAQVTQVAHKVGQNRRQFGIIAAGHRRRLLRGGVHGLGVAVICHGRFLLQHERQFRDDLM